MTDLSLKIEVLEVCLEELLTMAGYDLTIKCQIDPFGTIAVAKAIFEPGTTFDIEFKEFRPQEIAHQLFVKYYRTHHPETFPQCW